ncbi:14732_t:CDS:2, partial [Gigaspora margarita]
RKANFQGTLECDMQLLQPILVQSSPAALKEHLVQLLDFIESTKLMPECIKDINRALVKAFVVCRILFHIIENPFFIELLKTLRLA